MELKKCENNEDANTNATSQFNGNHPQMTSHAPLFLCFWQAMCAISTNIQDESEKIARASSNLIINRLTYPIVIKLSVMYVRYMVVCVIALWLLYIISRQRNLSLCTYSLHLHICCLKQRVPIYPSFSTQLNAK